MHAYEQHFIFRSAVPLNAYTLTATWWRSNSIFRYFICVLYFLNIFYGLAQKLLRNAQSHSFCLFQSFMRRSCRWRLGSPVIASPLRCGSCWGSCMTSSSTTASTTSQVTHTHTYIDTHLLGYTHTVTTRR